MKKHGCPGLKELFEVWWSGFIILDNIGDNWRAKLQYLRQKLRGWNCNLKGEQKRIKKKLLHEIEDFELRNESDNLEESYFSRWH